MILEARPGLSREDALDVLVRHPVAPRHVVALRPGRAVRPFRANRSHLIFRQLAGGMVHPEHMARLPHFVELVVLHAAEEQVVRVDAVANVAGVQHAEAWWNRASTEAPGRSVREGVLKMFVANRSVAVASNPADPQPAVVSLDDFGPEASGEWQAWKAAQR